MRKRETPPKIIPCLTRPRTPLIPFDEKETEPIRMSVSLPWECVTLFSLCYRGC
jgi:hypothetical protein